MKTITLNATETNEESIQYDISGEGFTKVEVLGILHEAIRIFQERFKKPENNQIGVHDVDEFYKEEK